MQTTFWSFTFFVRSQSSLFRAPLVLLHRHLYYKMLTKQYFIDITDRLQSKVFFHFRCSKLPIQVCSQCTTQLSLVFYDINKFHTKSTYSGCSFPTGGTCQNYLIFPPWSQSRTMRRFSEYSFEYFANKIPKIKSPSALTGEFIVCPLFDEKKAQLQKVNFT